jgi:hypothetical protein
MNVESKMRELRRIVKQQARRLRKEQRRAAKAARAKEKEGENHDKGICS